MRFITRHPSSKLVYAAGEGGAGSWLANRFAAVTAKVGEKRYWSRGSNHIRPTKSLEKPAASLTTTSEQRIRGVPKERLDN